MKKLFIYASVTVNKRVYVTEDENIKKIIGNMNKLNKKC